MKRVARNQKIAKQPKPKELSGAWAPLRDRLAEALGVLEEGQYLVLSGARGPYYVQFAMEEGSWLLAEAVGDAFLEKGQKLGKAQKATLLKLGWKAPFDGRRGKEPRRGEEGSPNFHRRIQGKDDLALVATMAVRALREVYGFRRPGSLRYHAFEGEGGDILLPTLGLGRCPEPVEEAGEEAPASLEEEVLEAVREGLGVEDAGFDRNGFLMLEAEGEPVFVLLLDGPPCVRLFTPVLVDVTNEDEALGLLNTLNFEGRHARFVLDEGTVLAVIDLPGEPFVPDHFVESFMALASAAHELPDSLEKAIGGRVPSKPATARTAGARRRRAMIRR